VLVVVRVWGRLLGGGVSLDVGAVVGGLISSLMISWGVHWKGEEFGLPAVITGAVRRVRAAWMAALWISMMLTAID